MQQPRPTRTGAGTITYPPARDLPRLALRHPTAAAALLLTLLYLASYGAQPALPGNNPAWPLGWWGWFDQGRYIDSARALGHGNLDPANHWYPLGYALLGAPFTRWSPAHPFILVDLASLLGTLAAFTAFARRLAVPAWLAAATFVTSTACHPAIFDQWVVPWNTTPAAALTWLLLATAAAHMAGERRPVRLGLLAAALPLLRPTEAILAAPALAAALLLSGPTLTPAWRHLARDLPRAALGALALLAPYALLHLAIYGPHPTEYMVQSRQLGFTLHNLGWKAYVVLVDPRAWFLDGMGLLRPAPFIALALPGALVAVAHGRAATLLAALLTAHTVLYLSYVDLLPVGLWRYNNVHYWTWAMPGFGLLAVLLARDLLRARQAPAFPLAPAALLASLLPLCLRLTPTPATPAEPATMLLFPGPAVPGFDPTYFGPTLLQDAAGTLPNITAARTIPVPGGLRAFPLRRTTTGTPTWNPPPEGWTSTTPARRFRIRLGWGLPCWLRGVHCEKVADDNLLPPVP